MGANCIIERRRRSGPSSRFLRAGRYKRFVGFSVESGLHEYADPLDRSPSLWDDARVVLPTVRHTRPFLQFNFTAGSTALFSHPHGIVAQDFIAANLDEQRRKSRCVPVKR